MFSIRQAEMAGVSASTVRDRVKQGRYERMHRGVFRVVEAQPSWQADVVALVLSVPNLAAASHKTAAHLWGMSSIVPDPVEIVTVRHRRTKQQHPQIHESKDLVADHVEIVRGIQCTSAVRTVVDLGATASRRYVAHCLDTALRLELFQLGEVERFIARHARSGRNGIGKIRPLVEERLRWNMEATESVLEERFLRLLADAFVPLPEPQLVLHDERGRFIGRFDFAYPASNTLIEIDSEAFHSDNEAFQRDREKQNAATGLGWRVLRITSQQMTDKPAETVALVRSASQPF